MNTELLEKIKKLPLWAREHIRELQIRSDPQTEEIVRLRRQVERLMGINRRQKEREEAMVAMFQCAAKGGNEVAAAVQKIVEDWITYDLEEKGKTDARVSH